LDLLTTTPPENRSSTACPDVVDPLRYLEHYTRYHCPSTTTMTNGSETIRPDRPVTSMSPGSWRRHPMGPQQPTLYSESSQSVGSPHGTTIV
jgi:hypothetical protein